MAKKPAGLQEGGMDGEGLLRIPDGDVELGRLLIMEAAVLRLVPLAAEAEVFPGPPPWAPGTRKRPSRNSGICSSTWAVIFLPKAPETSLPGDEQKVPCGTRQRNHL